MTSHTRSTSVPPPAWQQDGLPSTQDTGQYQRGIESLRTNQDITATQVAQVIDVIAAARRQGNLADLDPTTPLAAREQAFGQIMRPAIARGDITGLTLTDLPTLRMLYDATLGWGTLTQALLDDPAVTELKIIDTTVTASGSRGTSMLERVYASVEEPISRIQALAQMLGVTWDRTHASVTLPLPNKTRLHATRAPLLPDDSVLIVVRRGRTRPWMPNDLVERGALDAPTAELLTALVQSGLSFLVAGPQDAGKTTALECLLNVLPATTHMVLVEDATDEFQLRATTVSRLQVNSQAADAFGVVVRETLRMTPDVLVPCEVRGSEAGAVLQIAEAGRPTLTTIHADTPEAAIDRFARMAASDVPGNSFAGREAAATRTVARAFHVVVQMQRLPHQGRRIVQEVALLDGVDAQGRPILRPLVTARLPDAAQGEVIWDAHAALVGGKLVWRDATTTPRAVAQRLAGRASGSARPAPAQATTAAHVTRLLDRAATLIADETDASEPITLLTQAWEIDPQCGVIYELLDRLLAQQPEFASTLASTTHQIITDVRAHLDLCDLEAASTLIRRARTSLVLVTALDRSLVWTELCARTDALRARMTALETALTTAHVHAAAHDTQTALALLQPFDQQQVPPALRARLLEARLLYLQHQLRGLGPLASDERSRIERRIMLTRLARDPLTPPDPQLPGTSLALPGDPAAPAAPPAAAAAPARAPGAPLITPAPQVVLVPPAPDGDLLAAAYTADDAPDIWDAETTEAGLPFVRDATDEVGATDWRQHTEGAADAYADAPDPTALFPFATDATDEVGTRTPVQNTFGVRRTRLQGREQ